MKITTQASQRYSSSSYLIKTMSIYDGETSKKKVVRISVKKLTEVEGYLLDQIEVCERLAKKMKQFDAIITIVDTVLIISTVVTGGVFNAELNGTSVLFSLGTAITRKFLKIFAIKQKNTMQLSCLLKAS